MPSPTATARDRTGAEPMPVCARSAGPTWTTGDSAAAVAAWTRLRVRAGTRRAAHRSSASTTCGAVGSASPSGRTKCSRKRWLRSVVAVSDRIASASWARCSSRSEATLSSPVSGVGDVAEVQRSLLAAAEVRRQQREHRPELDRRLDLRARVDAHDGAAVVDRVVVVGLALGVDRPIAVPRPDDDPAGQLDRGPVPRLRVRRMRPDQDPAVPDQGIRRRADAATQRSRNESSSGAMKCDEHT